MNTITNDKKELSSEQNKELLQTLKTRFEKNMRRHSGLEWAKVQVEPVASPVKIRFENLQLVINIG
jgi:hypothetical protein